MLTLLASSSSAFLVASGRRHALAPLPTRRVGCGPVCELEGVVAGVGVAESSSAAAAGAAPADAVVTDTLLDLGVYGLLFGVVSLTLYSLFVTLQKTNEQYGGWTPRDDQDVSALGSGSTPPSERLRAGARYDPVTETWTYPTESPKGAKVGRAPAAAAAPDSDVNRYDRRMAKKMKKKSKKSKK